MWGAFVVFCACVCAFFWYLQQDVAKEQLENGKYEEQVGSRRRNRRKGRQQGGKKTSNKSTAAGTDAAIQPPIHPQLENTVRKTEAAAREKAHNHEWPTLGAARGVASASRNSILTAIDNKEDLAALHATLLNEKRIQAADVAAGFARTDNRGRDTWGVCVGDRVEARFGGGSQWFPATVTKLSQGGLVNLAYDDGGKETRVYSSLLRRPGMDAGEILHEETASESDFHDKTDMVPVHGSPLQHREAAESGWEVQTQKVRKAPQERLDARGEAITNLKNRVKRQKKREKELAAREALRKKL